MDVLFRNIPLIAYLIKVVRVRMKSCMTRVLGLSIQGLLHLCPVVRLKLLDVGVSVCRSKSNLNFMIILLVVDMRGLSMQSVLVCGAFGGL